MIKKYWQYHLKISRLFYLDIKSSYQKSRLKYFWDFVPNLITCAIWLGIYKLGFLRFGEAVPNFHIYVLSGLFLWQFLVDLINNPTTKTYQYKNVLQNNAVPFQTFFFVSIYEVLYLLSIRIIILFAVTLLSSDISTISLLVFTFKSLPYILTCMAIAYVLFPFLLLYKDLQGVVRAAIGVLFFFSGIVFPIPKAYEYYMVANPLYFLIQYPKNALISYSNIPELYLTCVLVFVIFVGLFAFKANKRIFKQVLEII